MNRLLRAAVCLALCAGPLSAKITDPLTKWAVQDLTEPLALAVSPGFVHVRHGKESSTFRAADGVRVPDAAPVNSRTGGAAKLETVAAGLRLVPAKGGTLQAFRAKDGKALWEYFVGSELPFAPVVGDGVIFLGAANDFLYGIGLDGRELWRHQCGPLAVAPVFAGGVLYALNDKGQLFAFEQRSAGKDLAPETAGFAKADPKARQTRLSGFLVEREVRRLVDSLSEGDLAKPARKPVLAVLAFDDGTGRPNALAPAAADLVIDAYARLPKYVLVERTRLEGVVEELKLGQSPFADPATALRLGRMLAADRVVTGSVTLSGAFYRISVRVVETETGRILKSDSVDIRRSAVDAP
jgi:TolB-like protein